MVTPESISLERAGLESIMDQGSTLLRYRRGQLLLLHKGREIALSFSADALAVFLSDVAREAGS